MPWRYTIGCVDQLELVHRAGMIWHKPNPMPESVTDRVVRAHETVFHFTRGPQYWHDPEHTRLPSMRTVPTTSLKLPTELEDARHFAAMPEALPPTPAYPRLRPTAWNRPGPLRWHRHHRSHGRGLSRSLSGWPPLWPAAWPR
ncbi:hypothetical protein AB0M05_34035 [Streptomyces violaceusniger]|uniref:hypothetical protein n=1 Tax=Streptomyces violaceusniger TaxID=68280 RepID=UPI0034444D7E